MSQNRELSFELLDELIAKVTAGDAVPEYMMIPDETGELVSHKVDVRAVHLMLDDMVRRGVLEFIWPVHRLSDAATKVAAVQALRGVIQGEHVMKKISRGRL